MIFTYGPEEQRWKTVLQHNGATERTTFYAGDYERITENGTTRHIYYLDHGVIYVLEDGDTEGEFYYTYTDHLGSITRIYNETDTTVFSAEYDAWGNQTLHQTNGGFTFHRGYTGHEMLPEFGLINMNGRLYDPILGRFLSPDNYVQMPDFSQSFNRYSYCLNNPLKYTDPSGELFGIDDAIACLLGGTINLSLNLISGDVHGIGQGLALFATGAVAGELALYGQPELSAIVIGGGNSIVNQGFTNGFNNISWSSVFGDSMMSLLTQGIGNKIGKIYNGPISSITRRISNNVVKGALTEGLVNFATGFSLGAAFSIGRGEGLSSSLKEGLTEGTTGLIIGSITGAVTGIRDNTRNVNFDFQPKPEVVVGDMLHNDKFPVTDGLNTNSVYVGTDDNGVIRYVGITERDPQIRFNEHYNSGTNRAKLQYRTIDNAQGLSRMQARIIEQRLINVYGMQKYNGQLYNKINSISPRYWNRYGLINR